MNRNLLASILAAATVLPLAGQAGAPAAQKAAPLPGAIAPAWFAGIAGRPQLTVPGVLPMQGLREHMRDGQLHLQLSEFLTLVLENDPNVHLQQLNNWAAEYALLQANSPFDPQLSLSFNSTRSVTPEYSQINGAPTLSNLSQISGVTYTQTLGTGQQLLFNFGGSRNSSNSEFNTFNPSIGADMNFELVQPLWRNRGNLQNRTAQFLARANILVVSDTTQQAVADVLVAAADQYWFTVQARDQVAVQQQALDLAQKSYERDQHALELGALAPGDIFTSQAQVATDKVSLLQAQANYKQQLDQLRRLIGADLDVTTQSADVVLEDDPTAVVPAPPPLPLDQAIATALLRRPEMDAAQRTVAEDNFSLAEERDALHPQLNLTGAYGGNGLGGDALVVTNSLGVASGGTNGGLGNALGQVFGFGYPTYGFTLSLNLPLRNSAGEAALAGTLLTQTSHRYSEVNERQQVMQDVRLADLALSMAVAEVQSATTARDLSQKNVDAEQQKYELGTITVFELLQAQVQLSGAQTTLLGAYTNYQVALITYERATWTLLDKLNLQVAARSGGPGSGPPR